MKDSEYDYFDCLRFYDLGKCMFHFWKSSTWLPWTTL